MSEQDLILGPYRVIEHTLEGEDVYRLVVGQDVIRPAFTREEPLLDEDGHPELDENLDPVVIGVPEPEVVLDTINIRDFVFAADDEQWFTKAGARRSATTVAADQRAIISAALTEEQAPPAEEPEPPSSVHVLPGAGETL